MEFMRPMASSSITKARGGGKLLSRARTIEWAGAGLEEKGVDAASGRVLVEVDPRYFRPTEVELLVGDASKARSKLGWHHKISFDELVAEIVAADLATVAGETSRTPVLAR